MPGSSPETLSGSIFLSVVIALPVHDPHEYPQLWMALVDPVPCHARRGAERMSQDAEELWGRTLASVRLRRRLVNSTIQRGAARFGL